jgi:hypothetical protein
MRECHFLICFIYTVFNIYVYTKPTCITLKGKCLRVCFEYVYEQTKNRKIGVLAMFLKVVFDTFINFCLS